MCLVTGIFHDREMHTFPPTKLAFSASTPLHNAHKRCSHPAIAPRRTQVHCAHAHSKRQDRKDLARRLSNELAAHSRTGDVAGMTRTATTMRNAGILLNGVNHTTLAAGLSRAGRPRACFDALAVMRDLKLRPSAVTLRVAADACIRWNDRRAAGAALEAMLEWWRQSAVAPDADAWRIALNAFARIGDVPRLLGTLESMRESVRTEVVPAADVRAWNVLLSALRGRHALAMFGAMLCARDRDKVRPDAVTYNTLLSHALKDRRFADTAGDPAAPYSVDDALIASLRFAGAVQSSMRARGVAPDATTWTALVRLVCRARPEDESIEDEVRKSLQMYWNTIQDAGGGVLDLIVRCRIAYPLRDALS